MNAWLLAIPSGISAVCTWYMSSRANASDKKTKTGFEDAEKTRAAQAELVAALRTTISTQNALINSQVGQIKILTAKVEETRASQVDIAAKHTETMDRTKTAVDKLASMLDPKAPHVEDPDFGQITKVDTPTQPLGKVIVKP